MNILKKTYSIGVLEIYAMCTSEEDVRNILQEDGNKFYMYAAKCTGEPNPMGWFMNPECVLGGATLVHTDELFLLYGTRNCADNVGIPQLNSIMQCILDNEDAITTELVLEDN